MVAKLLVTILIIISIVDLGIIKHNFNIENKVSKLVNYENSYCKARNK